MRRNGSNQEVTADQVTGELMWQAVLQRDGLLDGRFVYAVKSTGIYCRPSCAARRPVSVSRVEFFDNPDAAEQAGYRACLRCKPADGDNWQEDLARVQRACRILEEHVVNHGRSLTLDTLAARVRRVSPFHLQRCFKRIVGVSPKQYVDAVRSRQFRAMLQEGIPVGLAARGAGMRAPGTLYGGNAVSPGLKPSGYRNGAEGIEIDYTTVRCPLGLLLVAATDTGVCSIQLGDSAEQLARALRAEFRNAHLRQTAESLAPFVLAAVSALGVDNEASSAAHRLPLDIQATAFQWKVWLALRETKRGDVRSYSDLAAATGNAEAARAVGSACASNPVALAIPCHRAVRTDGSKSGYRWGVERKKAILAHEQVAAMQGKDTSPERAHRR